MNLSMKRDRLLLKAKVTERSYIVTKFKEFILLLSINIIALTSLLYGFEYYLKLTDPKYHLPPNGIVDGKLYTWGHLVVNNKYGFRERDFDIPKPKVYRIMVLGDSLTWGAGLDINERYTNLAESYLNQAFPERKFEVLNFGLRGGPTTMEKDILRKYKNLVKPNRIVVGFCLNDPQPKDQDYTIEREEFKKNMILSLLLYL